MFSVHSVQEELGSGQFGTVSKGVWMYQNEIMEVAVKVLTKRATEMNRVKFLQEAAIMGQFYHPNIVRLHGVVTVGNPVLLGVFDFYEQFYYLCRFVGFDCPGLYA